MGAQRSTARGLVQPSSHGGAYALCCAAAFPSHCVLSSLAPRTVMPGERCGLADLLVGLAGGTGRGSTTALQLVAQLCAHPPPVPVFSPPGLDPAPEHPLPHRELPPLTTTVPRLEPRVSLFKAECCRQEGEPDPEAPLQLSQPRPQAPEARRLQLCPPALPLALPEPGPLPAVTAPEPKPPAGAAPEPQALVTVPTKVQEPPEGQPAAAAVLQQ